MRKKIINRQHMLAVAVLSATAGSVFGVTKTYSGADGGNFSTGANWTPVNVPVDGDDVVMGSHSAVTPNVNVTVNLSVAPNLNSLTLNSSGLTGFMILNMTGGAFRATNEIIGSTAGLNTFNQTGGNNNVGGLLVIGASGAGDSYNLSGSTSTLTMPFGSTCMIGSGGTGTMSLANGTFTSTGVVELGVNVNSVGTLNISGGTYNGTGTYIGQAGSGTVNLTAGAFSSDSLTIASTFGAATFNFSGGTLSLFNYVYLSTNGTFNLQSGGVFGTSSLVGPGGTFKVAGGSFGSFGAVELEGGIFQLGGNNATINTLYGGAGLIQNGSASNSVITINMAQQVIGGNLIPRPFVGTIQNGGTGTLGITLTGGAANYGLELGGSSNTYSGPTTVAALLLAEANNVFSPNSPVIIQSGGILDTSTFSGTILSLSGSGGSANIATGGNLTISPTSGSTTYSGTLTGNGTLTKSGSGSQALSGGGTFTGPIVITAGTLAVSATNGVPTSATVSFSGIGGTFLVNANQSLASYTAGDLNATSFANNAILTVGTNNADSGIGAIFSGAGTFVKAGSGNYLVGFGSGDSFANSDASVAMVVNAGSLSLNKSNGTNSVAGPLTINGGSATLLNSNQIADTSTVALAGGIFDLNGFSETIGNLTGSSGNVSLGGGSLTVAAGAANTYAGTVTGPGSFIKSGAANLTLTGATNFSGSFIANSAKLIFQNAVSGAGFTANSGGTLQFNNAALNSPGVQILANSGGTVEYLSANISNAFLRGTGAHNILAGGTSTFNGVTTFNSTTITQNGPAILNNFTNGGTINNNAALTFSGGTNSTSGIINVNNAFATQDFTSNGVINAASGAAITNSISNLYLGGGSRTYIGSAAHPGGTVNLQNNTTVELNGGLLVNYGTINGVVDVNYGSLATGTGAYSAVILTTGGTFQPGNGPVGAPSVQAPIGYVNSTPGSFTTNYAVKLAADTLATVSASSDTLTLAGPLTASGISLTKNGSGTLNIPALRANALYVVSGKTAILPGAGASVLNDLSVASGSMLDLNDNNLILNYTGTSPAASVRQMLISGYGAGNWSGTTGVTSAIAHADASLHHTLGYGDAAALSITNFGGQTITGNAIVVKYTYPGDSNLDGKVDLDNDFSLFVDGYNKQISNPSVLNATNLWVSGDYNYDGKVDLDNDFSIFVDSYAAYTQNPAQLAQLDAIINSMDLTTAQKNQLLSVVPEPGTLALATILVTGLNMRRKRRRA